MPSDWSSDQSSRDLLSLSRAPLSDRIVALEAEWTAPDSGGPLPPRAIQVSGLILAEAIRLIRLGTRSELTGASVELAEVMARPAARGLADLHPEAHRLLSAAAVALAASSAPSSPGGELAVLRSWGGRAQEVVGMLSAAKARSLARSDIRARLGDVEESYLSHLLADLEGAGLATRIRDGRNVTVHLGPAGRSDHVQEQVAPSRYPGWGSSGFERDPDMGGENAIGAISGFYVKETARRRSRSAASTRLRELDHELNLIDQALPTHEARDVLRDLFGRAEDRQDPAGGAVLEFLAAGSDPD